jgi:predicted nucleic acid-binding protein
VSGRFLDTNILLRYLTRDDEAKAEKALNLLDRVELGEEKIMTSSLVIFETVFTLQKTYKVPRQQIRTLLTPIIGLKGLRLPGKNIFYRAFDLYITHNISFADAYNAAYMLADGVSEIYTWDTEFDKIEGVTRLEP